MQGCSIILCDMDQGYIRMLAAGLKKFFDTNVWIQTCSHASELIAADTDMTSDRIILCGQAEDMMISEEMAWKGHFIRLKGDVNEEETVDIKWEDEIYKYQPVSQIAARLQPYFPDWNRQKRKSGIKKAQNWYGIFSVCRHESVIPFVCSLAKKLGEQQKVLVVLLTQFCGISGLLELEHSCDTEHFFLRLQQCEQEEILQVALPQVLSFQAFDLLTEPENPQVLYEMSGRDIQALIARLEHSQYDSIVWAAAAVIPGIIQLFERSRRLFFIEKTDTNSVCCQREFEKFCNKLSQPEWEEKTRHVCLPVYGQMECGEHLLWQWSQSAVGSAAEQYAKEELTDGG